MGKPWVRFSTKYTPRNLVLLTVSTKELLMFSGEWSFSVFFLSQWPSAWLCQCLETSCWLCTSPIAIAPPFCMLTHRCCCSVWWCWRCSCLYGRTEVSDLESPGSSCSKILSPSLFSFPFSGDGVECWVKGL